MGLSVKKNPAVSRYGCAPPVSNGPFVSFSAVPQPDGLSQKCSESAGHDPGEVASDVSVSWRLLDTTRPRYV